MSRIGNQPIEIPGKVKVKIENGLFSVKGPKGEMELPLPEEIEHKLENNVLVFSCNSSQKKIKSLHGLTRALCANAVEGVTNGFTKVLRVEGIGYKLEMKGKRLLLSLGFSHPVLIIPPDGISIEAEPKANIIRVFGIDKQLVGQVAATIRKLRPPEPYKGKGIRYEGEYIRRKAGKTAA